VPSAFFMNSPSMYSLSPTRSMPLPHNLPHALHAMQAESKQEDVRAAKYLKQAGMILGTCVCVYEYGMDGVEGSGGRCGREQTRTLMVRSIIRKIRMMEF
jgi:hypothetical protein